MIREFNAYANIESSDQYVFLHVLMGGFTVCLHDL